MIYRSNKLLNGLGRVSPHSLLDYNMTQLSLGLVKRLIDINFSASTSMGVVPVIPALWRLKQEDLRLQHESCL